MEKKVGTKTAKCTLTFRLEIRDDPDFKYDLEIALKSAFDAVCNYADQSGRSIDIMSRRGEYVEEVVC